MARRNLSRGAALACAVLAAACGFGRPAQAEQTLAAVQMNGQSISDGELIDIQGDKVTIPADLLRRLRFKRAARFKGDQVVVTDIEGVKAKFDQASQTLRLEVDPQLLERTQIGGFLTDRPYDRPTETGFFANYTVLAQGGGGSSLASALFDLGVFSPLGAFSNDIATTTTSGFVRLQSHFGTPLDNGDNVGLGDAFLFPGALGQSFPFGGFSYTSRGIDEGGHATTPVQSILGQAALPSTVDIFVNDALQSRQTIDAGPFAVQDLPTVTGQGEVRVVIHDVLGREEVITRSFYGSTKLLGPGAEEYGFQGGLLRQNYGVTSFDYDEPFAAGTWRRGDSDWLTTEFHGEGSTKRQLLGTQGTIALGNLGAANLGAAASHFNRAGEMVTAGIESEIGFVRLGVSTQLSTSGFTQLGYTAERTLRESSQAHLSFNLGTDGSIDVSLLRFRLDGQRLSSTVAAGYSVSLANRLFIEFSLSDNVSIHDVGGFLTLNYSFGDGTNASASTTRSDGKWQTSVQANTPLPATEGMSYSGSAQYGTINQVEANAAYRSQIGDVGASAGTFNGSPIGRVTAAGSIEYVDGRIFTSRQENGAFALVETGEPGIHVAVDQQDQGVTDAAGQAYIPHLRPGEVNHVTIDPADIPLDAELPPATQEVVPRSGTGYVVRFPIRHLHGAILTLVTTDGQPVAPGSGVHLARTGGTYIVGTDGTAFLEDVVEGDQLRVETGGRPVCILDLHLPGIAAAQYQLGRVTCR